MLSSQDSVGRFKHLYTVCTCILFVRILQSGEHKDACLFSSAPKKPILTKSRLNFDEQRLDHHGFFQIKLPESYPNSFAHKI